MKQDIFTITENKQITADVFRMILKGDTSAFTSAGQFLNILVDGLYLRRPISVNDLEEGKVTILYKVIGKGTTALSLKKEGEKLDLLTGLGNGFDLSAENKDSQPLLIGGGIGIAPLYYLAKRLLALGCTVKVILGFRSASEVYYEDEFKKLGCQVFLATEDGSRGTKGFVTNVMPEVGEYSSMYTCGPEPMLKAVFRVNKEQKAVGQYSFEERMGCGFGACMGCSCKTVTGFKRICKDGPILREEEILWD